MANSKIDTFDAATRAYFNTFKPRYNPDRLTAFGEFYKEKGIRNVLDVGSGDGESVMILYQQIGSEIRFTLSDISEQYLPKQSAFEVEIGSILSESFVSKHEGKYQAVQCVSLLHHLVGDSRRASINNVKMALRNMARLVKKGGYVCIFEPTWDSDIAMSLVFYLKNFVGKYVARRVELGGRDLNIGQPVVSYLSDACLTNILRDTGLRVEKKNVYSSLVLLGVLRSKRMQYFVKVV